MNERYKEILLSQTLEELRDSGLEWDESYTGADTSLVKDFQGILSYSKLVTLATRMKSTSSQIRLNQAFKQVYIKEAIFMEDIEHSIE